MTTVEQKIVEVEGEIRALKQQLEAAGGNQELLTALRQELAALRQKEVLLMEQQAAAGPPWIAVEILQGNYARWNVQAGSTSTTCRQYDNFKLQQWEPKYGVIRTYLHEQLGSLLLPTNPLRQVHGGSALVSESEYNARFADFFGEPVAEVLAHHWGKRIQFHTNLPQTPQQGLPDFVFQDYSCHPSKTLLVGEGKTQAVLQLTHTLESSTCVSCAKQVADYMDTRGLTYGWLTCLNATYFIERVADDTYNFTDAIYADASQPTVLEMLAYIALKQSAVQQWQRSQDRYALGLSDDQQQLLTGTRSGPVTRSKAHAAPAAAGGGDGGGVMGGSGGGPGVHRALDLLSKHQSHGLHVLQWTDTSLGAGQCGLVMEGRFDGRRAAIKAIDISKQLSLLEVLEHEAATYERLGRLQGACIPELLGFGLWPHADSNTFFLATSLVEGQHASRSMHGALAAAEKVLLEVHALGVLHGDIRAENVLVAHQEEGWQVWLLDFGHSTFSTDAAAQRDELEQLARLFRRSNDSATSDVTMGAIEDC